MTENRLINESVYPYDGHVWMRRVRSETSPTGYDGITMQLRDGTTSSNARLYFGSKSIMDKFIVQLIEARIEWEDESDA